VTAGPTTGPPVRIGILGAGFVADLYLRALTHVRGHEVTVVSGSGPHRAKELAARFGVPAAVTGVGNLVGRDDVDLVLVAVPHDHHVEAVAAAANAGKAVVCTKPLGRNAVEAQACLDAVQRAGVWHGYAETEVFAPGIVKAKQLVDAGAIGRVTWVRAREAHGNPHPHARDKHRMGGGPLRGLGCHCVAIGRWFLTDAQPAEVMAWGDRLVRDDVTAEDSAVMLVRFDDGRMVQVEVGWTHIAGLDVRNEIHGSHGWIGTDETGSTGIVGFTGHPAGYVVEKAGSSQGWITPVPDEPWTYGYHAELSHFVDTFRRRVEPRQTLRDGVIDNAVIDAGYRSMETRSWESVTLPDAG
jgi:predicted dehydrogenase